MLLIARLGAGHVPTSRAVMGSIAAKIRNADCFHEEA
jgi:hypothetical protein